jgi:very-short-patch-repair endonuclease
VPPPAVCHPDPAIAALAKRQHGVVSRRQLLAAGVTARAIEHRLAMRRLHHVHRGVYAVGHPLVSGEGRYLAAVLACGAGAVVSHRSAAAMWDLRPSSSPVVHVTVARRGTRRRRGIAVHATRWLPSEEVAAKDAVPCTSPMRTLVDLAAVLRPRDLSRALERSLMLRLFDRAALAAALAHAGGRRGTGALGRLVAELDDEPPPARSELERRFLELVRAARLPAPVVNGRVGAYEVDFHWPAHRFVVETDGRATHDTPIAFERDRERDLALALAGFDVVRISWRQLDREPDRVAAIVTARVTAGSRFPAGRGPRARDG